MSQYFMDSLDSAGRATKHMSGRSVGFRHSFVYMEQLENKTYDHHIR